MSYTVSTVLNLLVVVGMVLGWIRFRKIQSSFLPFFLLLTFGFLHEAISAILFAFNYSNALIYNIYTLLEALLIIWQFKVWRVIVIRRKLFVSLFFVFVITWIAENFYLSHIYAFSSYFIILYSFIIVLLSINSMNILIVEEERHLLKNPIFLICTGFLIYFTYSIVVETFWMYGLNRDTEFQSRVYDILVVINLVANSLYTLSILWIPTKPKFILLS